MRKYLVPNQVVRLTHEIMVGSEYGIPIADGSVTIRNAGVDEVIAIPQEEATECTFEFQTPSVAQGELRIINYLVSIPTNIGMFYHRASVGVVDLLDIPVDENNVLGLLGVNRFELTNSHFDLVGGYLKYFKLLKPEFHIDRVADERLNKSFGDLISLGCALEVIPSLAIILDKKRATENGDVTRLATADDLLRLKDHLEDQLAALKDELSDYLDPEQVAVSALFQFIPLYQHSIGQ